MKKIKNKMMKIICLLMTVVQLTACTGKDQNISWPKKDELIFGTTLSTKSLDPANGYCGWFLVRYGVGETLFKLDEQMEAVPWLAESYEQVNAHLWKIKLKEMIYFQNGKELTTKAVKGSLERTLAQNARAAATLKIDKIEVEKDFIYIHTAQENPTLINDLCDPFSAIIDVSASPIDTMPIGTGPFKVQAFQQNGASYFERNAHYWDGQVKLQQIKVIPIGDSDTLAMALQSGEIDAAQGLSYAMVNLLKLDQNYKVESVDTSRAVVMYFNEENASLNDANVRRAINMLIDKQKYAMAILKGEAVAAVGAFPTLDEEGQTLSATTYNPEAAVALLQEIGYKDIDGDGILARDGEKLSFKLVTYSSRAELTDIAQSIQNDLKNVGIDVKVVMSENIADVLSAGQFDLALYSNITSATGDPLAYLNNAMKTDGTSNYGHYSNQVVDMYIEKLAGTFEKSQREAIAEAIEQIVLEEDGYNFIAHMKMSFVVKNNVVGLKPHPTDYYQFTAQTEIQ